MNLETEKKNNLYFHRVNANRIFPLSLRFCELHCWSLLTAVGLLPPPTTNECELLASEGSSHLPPSDPRCGRLTWAVPHDVKNRHESEVPAAVQVAAHLPPAVFIEPDRVQASLTPPTHALLIFSHPTPPPPTIFHLHPSR